MSIEWNDNFSIGTETLDNQHKGLFAAVGEMTHKLDEGKNEEAVSDIIAFLKAYAKEHFSTEEAIMEERGFPETEEHRKLHDEIKEALSEFDAEFKEKGATDDLAERLHGWLSCWICDHIARDDRSFGAFLETL